MDILMRHPVLATLGLVALGQLVFLALAAYDMLVRPHQPLDPDHPWSPRRT